MLFFIGAKRPLNVVWGFPFANFHHLEVLGYAWRDGESIANFNHGNQLIILTGMVYTFIPNHPPSTSMGMPAINYALFVFG
ncbi:hypothetical protein [Nostoc sp. FACHB-110]|uniref:hypothetical protein n=1 Tax=Nostoc sp. FACHB-110 TaxID=2692834 RepID=UPI00168A263B|nr:hypothetical protein [Nostoc sp. FACHB-110]